METAPKGLPSQINTVGNLAFETEVLEAERRTTVGILLLTGLSFIVCDNCSRRLTEAKTKRITSDCSERKRGPDFQFGGMVWFERREFIPQVARSQAERSPFQGVLVVVVVMISLAQSPASTHKLLESAMAFRPARVIVWACQHCFRFLSAA